MNATPQSPLKKKSSFFSVPNICFWPLTTSFFLTFSILVSFLLTAPLTYANNNSAAVVLAVRGAVKAEDSTGNIRSLKVNSALFTNDKLNTGRNGRIQIMFTDNTIISLGRKSSLKIAEYVLNNDKTGALKTEVSEGVFRVMGGILTKTSPDKFSTRTPSGTIGIRGSMYTGQVKDKATTVIFEGGKGITFSNQRGMITISQPGHGTKINGFRSQIPKPFKFLKKDIQAFTKDLSTTTKGANAKKGTSGKGFKPPVNFSNEEAAAISKKSGKQSPEQPNIKNKNNSEPKESKDSEPQSNDLKHLTEQVQSNPAEAVAILKTVAAKKNIKIENAVEAVFRGMKNPSREDFDAVIYQAMEMGITVDGAKDIIKNLKDSGGICK